MVTKLTFILLASLTLIGCTETVKIKSDTQEVFVPIIYCPEPPDVKRPALPILNMTPEQEKQPGEVAKSYKATVKALQGYAVELEKVMRQYRESNTSYDELKTKIENEWRTRQQKPQATQ